MLFNIIHDEEFTLSGCTIDINPIKADETGTLETYLPTAEAYLTEKAQNNKHTDLDVAKQLITDYLDSEFDEPSDFSDISKISLAYTTDEEHDLPIQVYADLEQFRLIYEYDGNVVRNEQYNSLAEMNKMLCRYLISVTLYHFPMMRFYRSFRQSLMNRFTPNLR